MADDDLLQLLGFISQKENRRRKKKKTGSIRPLPFKQHLRQIEKNRQVSDARERARRHPKQVPSNKPKEDTAKGFWDKLAQESMSGLNSVIDIISRTSFASTAVIDSLESNDKDYTGEPLRYNMKADSKMDRFESLMKGSWLNLQRGTGEAIKDITHPETLVEAAKEGWKGFSHSGPGGKKYKHGRMTTLEQKHKENPNNPWIQTKGQRAFLGLFADLALDPATYVGVGAVTKPLKYAAEVKMDKQLAKELETLGVKHDGTDIDITADDYLKLMHGTRGNVAPANLTRKERKVWMKSRTVRGRDAFRNPTDSVRATARRLENLKTIKAKMPQTRADFANTPNVRPFRKLYEQSHAQFQKAIDNVGKESLYSAVAKVDAQRTAKSIQQTLEGAGPSVGNVAIGGELTALLDDSVQVSHLNSLVKTHGFLKKSRKDLEEIETRLSKEGKLIDEYANDPDWQKATKNIEGNKKGLTKLTDKWTFGGGLKGQKEVNDLLEMADDLARVDETYLRHTKAGAKINEDLKKLPQSERKGDIGGKASSLERARDVAYGRARFEKTRILRSLLHHKAQGTTPVGLGVKGVKRLGEIDEQLARHSGGGTSVEDLIKSRDQAVTNVEHYRNQPGEVALQNRKSWEKEVQRVDERIKESRNVKIPDKVSEKNSKEVNDLITERNALVGPQDNIKEIDARIKEIDKELAGATTVQKAGSVGGDVSGGAEVSAASLRNERKALKKQRSEAMLDALKSREGIEKLDAPEEVQQLLEQGMGLDELYAKAKAGELSDDAWERTFVANVEERTILRRNTLIYTANRRKKELLQKFLKGDYGHGSIPKELQPMFEKPKKGMLKHKIELDGKVVTKGGAENRKLLAPHVTDADRAKAEAANKASVEEAVVLNKINHEEAQALKNVDKPTPGSIKPSSRRPKKGKKATPAERLENEKAAPEGVLYKDLAPNVYKGSKNKRAKISYEAKPTTVLPVTKKPEDFAFDRLFQEQHGMSMESAMSKLQIDAGDYVKMRGNPTVSRVQFEDYIRQHPDEVGPSGTGLELTINGEKWTYARLKKEEGTWSDKFDDYVLDEDQKAWWTQQVDDAFRNSPDAEVAKSAKGIYNALLKKQREARKKEMVGEFNTNIPKRELDKMTTPQMLQAVREDKLNLHLSEAEVAKLDKQAEDEALESISKEWDENGDMSLAPDIGDAPIIIENARKTIDDVDLDDLKDTTIKMLESNYEQAKTIAKGEFENVPQGVDKSVKATSLQNHLQRLWDQKEADRVAYLKSMDEAIETQELMMERLEEHMILSAVEASDQVGRSALRLTVAGVKVLPDIGTTQLFKATEKFANGPVINKATAIFAKSFTPASKLAPEINKARLRSQSRTAELIKTHVTELSKTFRSTKPRRRANEFRMYRRDKKAISPLNKAIESEFDALVPYVDGTTVIGQTPITLFDVNKYLPAEFRFVHPTGKHTNQIKISKGIDLVQSMRNMPSNADPMKALWALRVATEQAQAERAMINTMTGTFGIKRGIKGSMTEADHLVEELHKTHGWVTIKGMGEDYYFDPDTAKEIYKLQDMMKPRNAHEITKIYDKIQHIWKGAVTVYNPGYYTRNGIGEVMMGMFDGLYDTRYYTKSARVLSHINPDSTKQALKALDPWQAHQANRAKRNAGLAAVATLQSGRKLSVEDIDVLYSNTGLRTGFVSTEFDHQFPAAGTLRASMPGRGAAALNDAVRKTGEKYEDYFRMAHFIYRLEKAPKGLDIDEAADWAANFVRKYHFDYTDFTPFEKTTMLRLFPFYKWTRKSFPLMASMLFTRPGNVLFYPKTMQNISYGMGGTDPAQDENGFLPNYEDAATTDKVVPSWVQGFFAYPMGKDEEGSRNYVNVATPAMDIYKMAGNPGSMPFDMLSPLIKAPFEQLGMPGNPKGAKDWEGNTQDKWLGIPNTRGQTLDPQFNSMLDSPKDKQKHLANTTPLGSLLWKIRDAQKNPGDTDDPLTERGSNPILGGNKDFDETILSYLSGLGQYENNKDRQEIEKFFRKMKK